MVYGVCGVHDDHLVGAGDLLRELVSAGRQHPHIGSLEPSLKLPPMASSSKRSGHAGSGNDTLWVSMNSRSPRMPISRPSPLLRSPPNGARSSRNAAPWLFTKV